MGEWIPEPLPERMEWSGGATVDPADHVTLDESVNMAFLVVLESMTPAERVAFILHDVFRYAFAEVADIVGRTQPRQAPPKDDWLTIILRFADDPVPAGDRGAHQAGGG
ncbi:hypothetical protein ABT294_25720 [Nonomuraea sp. NPDC000554]|uniref:hypothetical protein n=1 Tax=Nonomuraea sp. NPDC000554 TaxID=3154259 RepID=UPI003333CC06